MPGPPRATELVARGGKRSRCAGAIFGAFEGLWGFGGFRVWVYLFEFVF